MRLAIIFCLISILFAQNSHELASNHAKFYKKALPVRTMNNLILTDILAVQNILIYRYSVNDTAKVPVSKLDNEKLNEYKNILTKIAKQSCKQNELKRLLDAGVVLEHVLYFELTRLIFEIKIDSKICDSL